MFDDKIIKWPQLTFRRYDDDMINETIDATEGEPNFNRHIYNMVTDKDGGISVVPENWDMVKDWHVVRVNGVIDAKLCWNYCNDILGKRGGAWDHMFTTFYFKNGEDAQLAILKFGATLSGTPE